MKTQIVEVTTLIKQTREEAITLAHEIGGGEVHALHIQRGFGTPAEQPVGYLVKPLKPLTQWQRLTDEERNQFRQWAHPEIIDAIELKLRERNP